MPIYEFSCESCNQSFETMTTMNSRDAKVPCPHCNSKKTARKLSVVAVGGGAQGSSASASGHTHTGMCGCGKRQGSCGMN